MTKDEIRTAITATAKKFGFDVEDGNAGDNLSLTYRSGPNDEDEPTAADIRHVRTFAKDLANVFPAIKQSGIIKMEFVDEWIDLTIDLAALAQAQANDLNAAAPVARGTSPK